MGAERVTSKDAVDLDPLVRNGHVEPDLDYLLDLAERWMRRFVVFRCDQAPVALALWVAHTHAFEAAEATPYMCISSAESESGKSRVLEILDAVVSRPWYVDVPSEATVYRYIDAEAPTLLLDECDAIFADKADSQGMRGLLNAGFRRGRKVPRCMGKGSDQKVKTFEVFCPKALAGIGRLPHTIETRKIPVDLLRKRKSEQVERFRLGAIPPEAKQIREGFEKWASDAAVINTLKAARPHLPDALTDRQQDAWEPLLAIADMAGGEWPRKARAASKELHGSTTPTMSDAVMLLAHIRDAFGGAQRIHTETLLEALVEREDGPWALMWGKDLHNNNTRGPAARLSRMLRDFEVKSKDVRAGEDSRNKKGYERADFEDAWARYLPSMGNKPDPRPDPPTGDATRATEATPQVGVTRDVASVTSVASPSDGETHENYLAIIRDAFPNAEPVSDEELDLLEQQRAIDEHNDYVMRKGS